MGLTSRRVVEASKSARSAERLRALDGRPTPNAGDDGPMDGGGGPPRDSNVGRKRAKPLEAVMAELALDGPLYKSQKFDSQSKRMAAVIEGLASGTESDQKLLREAWEAMSEDQKDDIVRVLHHEFRDVRAKPSSKPLEKLPVKPKLPENPTDADVEAYKAGLKEYNAAEKKRIGEIGPSRLNPRGEELEQFLFDGTPVSKRADDDAGEARNFSDSLLDIGRNKNVTAKGEKVDSTGKVKTGLEARSKTEAKARFQIVREGGRRIAYPEISGRQSNQDKALDSKARTAPETLKPVKDEDVVKSGRGERTAFSDWFHNTLGLPNENERVARAKRDVDETAALLREGVTADPLNYAFGKLLGSAEDRTALKAGTLHPSERFRTPLDMANALIKLAGDGGSSAKLSPSEINAIVGKAIDGWDSMSPDQQQQAVRKLPANVKSKVAADVERAEIALGRARLADHVAEQIASHPKWKREGWTHTPMAAEPSRRTGDLESTTPESRLPPSNTAEPDVATEEIMSKIPTPPKKPRAPRAPATPATPVAPSVVDSPAGLTPEVSDGVKPKQRYYFKGIDDFSPKRQEVAGFVEADSPEQAAKMAAAKGVSNVTVRPADAPAPDAPTVEAKPTTPQQRAEAAAARAIEGEKAPKQKELFGQGDEPPPGTPPAAPPGTDLIPSGPSPQMDTGDPTFRRDPNAVETDEPSTRGSTRQLVPAGRLEVPTTESATGSRALIVPDSLPKNVTDNLDNAGIPLGEPPDSAVEPLVGELVPAGPGPRMDDDRPNFRHPTGLSIPERELALPPNHQSTARPIDPGNPVEPETIDGEWAPATGMAPLGPRGLTPNGDASGVDGPNFRPDPNAPKSFQGNVRPKAPGTPDATPDPADPNAKQPKSWLRRALPYAAGTVGLAWLLNEGSRQNARDNQERIGGGGGGGPMLDAGLGGGLEQAPPMPMAEESNPMDAAGRLRYLEKLGRQGINPHTQTSINWTH